jgi:membrane protein YdbS with pleckstrin-like domain
MIQRLINIFKESTRGFDGQEKGENVVLLLRQHRFTIYLPISFIILFALVPVILWLALQAQIEARHLKALFLFLSSLWYLALWAYLFYLLTLYSLNTVVVTDRRIIENEQFGFFNRKVSELPNYRVQDVSVRTHGMIETFLNFGDIVVQTAAAEREFTFHKITNPEMVKDKIMQVVSAHQKRVGLN